MTLRSIALAAGVDVALVSYYFGSKQALFAAVMALPANPADLFQAELEGDLDTLAERVVRAVLAVWDNPETGTPLRAIVAAAMTEPEIARLLRELVGREIVERLAERLGAPDGAERAAAFTTQVAGLIFARYLLALEPIATLATEDVVAQLAPAMQLALSPGLPAPRIATPRPAKKARR